MKKLNIFLKEEYYKKARFGYIIALLICLMIRAVGCYLFAPPAIEVCAFSALGLVGVFLILWGLLIKNIELNFKKYFFQIVFLVCIVISSVVNIKYGFFRNLKDFLWMAINFFVLFLATNNVSRKEKYKFLVTIQNIIIYTWLALSFISLITFLFQINHIFHIREGCWVGIGSVEGRLFGVFLNPNTASIISLISIIFSVFQLVSAIEFSAKKFVNIFNIAIQFSYIVLAESRGTALVLIFCVFLVTFLIAYKKLNFKNVYKIILALFIAAISCVAVFLSMKFLNWTFYYLAKFVQKINPYFLEKKSKDISVQRTDYIENNDISNLRFRIWLSAWEIFKKNWLFGVSSGNVVEYAKDVFPETFIAKRSYARAHSVWIGLPLYTGIAGAISMYAFFAVNFFKTCKHYFKNYLSVKIKESDGMLMLSALLTGAICVYGLVESELFFVNSICSLIFWVYFGFLADNLNSNKKLEV